MRIPLIAAVHRAKQRVRRLAEMRNLYANWPIAIASRAGLYKSGHLHVFLLRWGSGSTVPLLADLGERDVRTVNEMWIDNPYVGLFVERFPEAPVVVDFGANRGYFAIYAALELGADVHCFEPHPANVRLLQANVALNAARVTVHPVAVITGEAAQVELFSGTSPWLHTTVSPSRGAAVGLEAGRYIGDSFSVSAVNVNDALSGVLARSGRITLLKSDTEGVDLELLESIDPEILAKVECVAAEFSGGNPTPVLDRLMDYGFQVKLQPPFVLAWR